MTKVGLFTFVQLSNYMNYAMFNAISMLAVMCFLYVLLTAPAVFAQNKLNPHLKNIFADRQHSFSRLFTCAFRLASLQCVCTCNASKIQ